MRWERVGEPAGKKREEWTGDRKELASAAARFPVEGQKKGDNDVETKRNSVDRMSKNKRPLRL